MSIVIYMAHNYFLYMFYKNTRNCKRYLNRMRILYSISVLTPKTRVQADEL